MTKLISHVDNVDDTVSSCKHTPTESHLTSVALFVNNMGNKAYLSQSQNGKPNLYMSDVDQHIKGINITNLVILD